MEYPDNPLEAIGAQGAFVIGDNFKFGQEYSESIIRALFKIPTSNLGDALDLIREQLLKLPLDVLKVFKDFIPDAGDDDFIDVITSVTTIIDNLIAKPVWDTLLNTLQLICQFLTDNPLAQCIAEMSEDSGDDFALKFVKGLFNMLDGLWQSLQMNTLAQCLVDWFTGMFGSTGQFVTDLVGAAMHLLSELATILTDNPLINVFKDLVEDSGLLLLNVVNGAVEALQRLMNLLGFANPAAALEFFDNAVTELWELLSGAAALGAKTVEDIFDVLTSWVGSVPLLGPLIYAITGLASISSIEELGDWIRTNLLTIASRLNAGKLFGQIPAAVMGVLNIGHLTGEPVNLLLHPNFEDATTVSPVDGWSWDGAENASGTGGSVKVVCDGYNKELSHQTAVLVASGDAMSLSAKVKTSGVTGAGWKASITVMEYRNGAIATPVVVASRSSNTSSWVTVSGSYTVPAGVSSVVFRLYVENATAGTIWFDDMDFHKSGSIAQDWVGNLTDTWETIYTGVTGGAGAGKRWNDMAPALGGVSSTANTASTNAGTANTNLGFTWNSLWDAFNGTSGSTGKGYADTASKAGAVSSTANTASTNAGTANTNLGFTWNSLWDAFNGTSGATGKTFTDTASKAGAVRATANTASTNANTAISSASTAQGTANSATSTANTANTNASTAIGTANTANGRAVAINNRLFNTNDVTSSSVVQPSALPLTTILPTAGSGALMTRRATANVNVSPGRNPFPNGFFTNLDVASTDISAMTTGGVAGTGSRVDYSGVYRVSLAGWYMVEIAVRLNPSFSFDWKLAPLIYKGTTLNKNEMSVYKIGCDVDVPSRYAQSSFIVYLNVNETIAAGYDAAGAANELLDADLTGAETYFSMSLLNRSYQ